MTVWDLFGLCRRFWLVTLTGLALTAGAVLFILSQEGTYSGQVNVILLAPESVRGNALADTTDSLISLTGVLGRITGGPGGDANPASDTVTLVGEGIHDGFSIQQPHSGGQYGYVFEQPLLNVQSAGETLDEAKEQMSVALASIQAALDQIEQDAGVNASSKVGIQLSPSEPAFTYQHGSRTRALAGVLTIGIILTVTAVAIADQIVSRRGAKGPVSRAN